MRKVFTAFAAKAFVMKNRKIKKSGSAVLNSRFELKIDGFDVAQINFNIFQVGFSGIYRGDYCLQNL